MERARSHWAWGWSDKLPDLEARRGLGAHAGAILGIDGLEPTEPVPLEEIVLPAPRIVIPSCFEGVIVSEPRDRIFHTYGRAYLDLLRGFRGDFAGAPDAVAYPAREEDIVTILRWASEQRVAVVPFGGGTSVVGGVEASAGDRYAGVVALDLRRMDRVLEVDEVSRSARAQAGVFGPSLEKQLGERGYSLRHYPQSFEFSTLGGWIATRAGGHFATLYTHIDDLVESMRVVTPAGVLETRRLPASGAGPSADRLMLGSEGALGVVVEAWLRVQQRPRWRESASILFDDFFAGASAARKIAQAGLFPSNCRLLDAREALLNGVADGSRAVLLLGFESSDHPLSAWMERALDIVRAEGGVCPRGPQRREEGARGGDAAAETWRSAFFDAPYLQSALVTLGVVADTLETACTWDRFQRLHAAVTGALRGVMETTCIGTGSVSCRFSHVYPDGPAPYFTFLCKPRTAGTEVATWHALKQAASEALIAQGATITHHHAVGRTHRPWYDRERSPLFGATLAAAKSTLDPSWIMNPGVLVDER